MRKLFLFDLFNIYDGIEFFLMPSKITSPDDFSKEFYRKVSKLKNKSIHIGDEDESFLILPQTEKHLEVLHSCLLKMEADRIVVHANHFKNKVHYIRELLRSALPGVTICVENVDYHRDFGYSVNDLLSIFDVCPEFRFCLDTAHVWDRTELSLLDFFKEEKLKNRIVEIHFSSSTRLINRNNISFRFKWYLEKYHPFHALFVLTDFTELDPEIKSLISSYPVIIEGILPVEDSNAHLLNEEKRVFSDR